VVSNFIVQALAGNLLPSTRRSQTRRLLLVDDLVEGLHPLMNGSTSRSIKTSAIQDEFTIRQLRNWCAAIDPSLGLHLLPLPRTTLSSAKR